MEPLHFEIENFDLNLLSIYKKLFKRILKKICSFRGIFSLLAKQAELETIKIDINDEEKL